MTTLVIGGAASGKSAYAESLAVQSPLSPRIYIATMQPFDQECLARIARHQRMRAQKGFSTVELYTPAPLPKEIPPGALVLLECIGNLTANTLYAPDSGGAGATVRRIAAFLHILQAHAGELILVSNDVFGDGQPYPPETAAYLEALGTLNQLLASMADAVIEVVCGIPVPYLR